jgi:hypothetical protein
MPSLYCIEDEPMDEREFMQNYQQINPRPCVFEKALLT